jgi:hypothetical protein
MVLRAIKFSINGARRIQIMWKEISQSKFNKKLINFYMKEKNMTIPDRKNNILETKTDKEDSISKIKVIHKDK